MSHTILIANGKDFYDITDLVPKLLVQWEEEGKKCSKKDAIEALMKESRCNQYAEGETYFEAVVNLKKVNYF